MRKGVYENFKSGGDCRSRSRQLAVVAATLLLTLLCYPLQASVEPNGEVNGLKAKFVDVNGIRTRYYEMGSGEPMVLVHGEGWSGHSSANAWSKNIRGLSEHFHVYAYDKIGSGMTDNPKDDKDYNLQGEIDHLYQFIQTMKLGKVHLVGQSHGSADIMFLALQHPEVVRDLIMCDTLTAAPPGPSTRQQALADCPKEPDWVEWKCRVQAITARPDLAFDDEYFEAGKYMASLPVRQVTVAKVKAGAGAPLFDMRPNSGFNAWKVPQLERIQNEGTLQVPVLLYWGHDDPSAILARGLDLYNVLAAKNPRVRMIIVNKAGHFHFREYPEEFNYNVTNFIEYWEHHPAEPAKAEGQ
ncbi:MAG: alpha/beta fold hydrolase [Candidatus Acidiferrales bacterium]